MKKILIVSSVLFIVLLIFIFLIVFFNKKNNVPLTPAQINIPGFVTSTTTTTDGNPVTYLKNPKGFIEITDFPNATVDELQKPFQELGYQRDSSGIYSGTLDLQPVVHDMVAFIPKNGKIMRVMLTYYGDKNPAFEDNFRSVVKSLQ